MLRILRWALFTCAALATALGLWALWVGRYSCTDPLHGCAYLIMGALMFLALALGLAAGGGLVWWMQRSRDRLLTGIDRGPREP
ncbi:MAG TPA: hypothetical protein VMK65_08210 [Longimicrobiales bacterium]|nr:hypothetical protein [Longimicrobiales bacterium]